MYQAGIAAVHDWLKWVRRAHDVGDGAVAGAFAVVIDAADLLIRAGQSDGVKGTSTGAGAGRRQGGSVGAAGVAGTINNGGVVSDTTATTVFNADDLTADVLLWPWGAGGREAPSQVLREAKTASLRAALAATAACSSPSPAAAAAMRRTIEAAAGDTDPGVIAAAASATPAAHLLAADTDTSVPLRLLADLAAKAAVAGEHQVRAAVAVAIGGLAAAGAALAAGCEGSVALRADVRDAGRRALTAAAAGAAATGERDAAATALNAAVAATAVATAPASNRTQLIVPVAAAAEVLITMLSSEEDAGVAAAALTALPRVLEHAQRSGGSGGSGRGGRRVESEALLGAAALSAAATPLALHASAAVRAALCAAAPAFAARGVLLDAAAVATVDANANEMETDKSGGGGIGGDAAVRAGLLLLQRLKANVVGAADAATRQSALEIFAAVAAALPYPITLNAALLVLLHRLDDKDAGVRAAAVDLVRAAAARLGVPPRELLLGNRLVATHLGVVLPNAPDLLTTLAEALLDMDEHDVLVELLPAAVPRLVERQDVGTLQAYASHLGAEYTVAGILQDWCYTAIADLINNGGERTPDEIEVCKQFLVSQTGCELEVLVADHKKDLMRTLIRSAGADDANDPSTEAVILQKVLGTLAELAASSSGTSAAAADAPIPPSVPDFIRPHFTWLVMGDATDRSGNVAVQRRFLRSLTVMVHLIGPHLPQFALKVMAHLASALERPSLRLRRDALAAWLLVVKQLAGHAPDHLRRVAGRIVVAMLPHLPDGNSGSGDGDVSGTNGGDGNRDGDGGDGSGGGGSEDSGVDNTAAAAEVIDELVLGSGAPCMKGHLARLPMLPACHRLALANAAVSQERGEVPLPSLLLTLTDGAEDESQAVRATALGELRRALRANPPAVSALIAGVEGTDAVAPAVVGRLVAALLRCCAGENRTVLARRVQRLAAQCLGELGAIDPGRIDMPLAPAEKLGRGDSASLARVLLCDHIARTVRGASDVEMLDAAALAVQEVLVHVGCRPVTVRAEDVTAADDGGDAVQQLPSGSTPAGDAFWAALPEDARMLLAPGLTSMYCLNQRPTKPLTRRPLYQAPGGPTFRRWMYAWCRALAAEATGPDAPLFAACSAGIFRYDTRTMLFLLPRMVLDALRGAGEAGGARRDDLRAEIMAVLHDAAGEAWGTEGTAPTPPQNVQKSLQGEQAELAAQAVFTLLDQLTAWSEEQCEGSSNDADAAGDGAGGGEYAASLLDSVPRELLARAALRCGAPARALLYFEDHLRARKNVLNQAALRYGEPEGGGLDDPSAAFLAAVHHALAEPDALEAISRLRLRGGGNGKAGGAGGGAGGVGGGGAAGGSGLGALAAARRRAEDALLQHEQAGEWTEALTHYESALQRGGSSTASGGGGTHGGGHGEGEATTTGLDPAEWGRLRCLQGLGHLRALEREADVLIAQRPAARAELAEAGAAAAWRLGRWDPLERFLSVLDDANSGMGGGASSGGGSGGGGFGGADGRPGGEAAVGRVLLALHRRDAVGVARAATAARDAVITPLAAAAMEGSYRRAHPAIVQLHLIREAEEAMAAVASLENCHRPLVANQERGMDLLANEGRAMDTIVTKQRRGMDLLADWEARLDLTPAALATREPILALRRATYAALGARDAGAYAWLAQAKLCRNSGHHGAAQLALLEARAALEGSEVPNAGAGAVGGGGVGTHVLNGNGRPGPGMALAVEQAKLLWATGRQHRAVVEIQEALDDSTLCGGDPLTTSRANLRLARWSAATGQRQKTDVLHIYSNVLRDQKHTEKANFHVAKYMDDLLKDALRREQQRAAAAAAGAGDGASGGGGGGSRGQRGRHFDVDERSIDYVIEIITHYATSLRYGHRHVYESLPRMLTLWFDVGAAAAAHEVPAGGTSRSGGGGSNRGGAGGGGGLTAEQQKERKVASQITSTLKTFSQSLPLYTWLPALPQLTSRLCHPHGEVRQVVHELLYRLVKNFPNQVKYALNPKP
jgi:serine/threonine-protein kinase ATR